MPYKEGGGNQSQPYDENTGRYTTSGNSRDYDKEISELKEKSKGLSLFNPQRREYYKQIQQLEAEKEGFSSYDELKQYRLKQSEEKDKQRQILKQKQQQQEEANRGYKMEHRPNKTGITADDLTNQDVETPMPDNFYDMLNKDNDVATKETMQQLNKVRNNPDAMVTIYRATTGDSINDGDWITLSKTYADTHNEHSLQSKGKVISMQVKAKDIQFAGDDIREWGYFPQENDFESGLKRGLNIK